MLSTVSRRAFSRTANVLKEAGRQVRIGWENFPNSEFAKQQMEKMHHAEGGFKMWRNISLFGCIPAIIIMTYLNVKWHEEEHHKPRPEFVDYEHLRRRVKPFPWGDGNHTLFHNPRTNPLPGIGYEVPDPALEHAEHGSGHH